MPPKVSAAASNDGVLPEDMLCYILVRLPAKTVCLFRAVCRSWRSLLTDPLFVAAHKSNHPGPLIVTCKSEMFERGTITIMDLSGHVVKRIATTMEDARLVRTCRLDLICITGRKGCHVINPATGDTFALPSCHAKEHAHVQHFFPESFDFGQVVSTGEYKALRCVSIDNYDYESSPMLCEVITLDDGRHARWRGKQGPPDPVTSNGNRSIVVNGVVYFLLDFLYKRFTFSGDHVKPGSMALFNLETEEWMGIVQGPMPVRRFVKDSNGRCGYFSLYLELSLVTLDGFLVMAHNPGGCSLDLWFLMDIEKCLWNKRYSLDFQPENLFAQSLKILNDGKIVLSASGSLRLYNPITKIYIDFGMRNSTSVGTYTGNLLSSESTFTFEAERCTTCGCYFTLETGQHDVTCQDCLYEASGGGRIKFKERASLPGSAAAHRTHASSPPAAARPHQLLPASRRTPAPAPPRRPPHARTSSSPPAAARHRHATHSTGRPTRRSAQGGGSGWSIAGFRSGRRLRSAKICVVPADLLPDVHGGAQVARWHCREDGGRRVPLAVLNASQRGSTLKLQMLGWNVIIKLQLKTVM